MAKQTLAGDLLETGRKLQGLQNELEKFEAMIAEARHNRSQREITESRDFKMWLVRKAQRRLGALIIDRQGLRKDCAHGWRRVREYIRRIHLEPVGDDPRRSASQDAALSIWSDTQTWALRFRTSIEDLTKPVLLGDEQKTKLRDLVAKELMALSKPLGQA